MKRHVDWRQAMHKSWLLLIVKLTVWKKTYQSCSIRNWSRCDLPIHMKKSCDVGFCCLLLGSCFQFLSTRSVLRFLLIECLRGRWWCEKSTKGLLDCQWADTGWLCVPSVKGRYEGSHLVRHPDFRVPWDKGRSKSNPQIYRVPRFESCDEHCKKVYVKG